MNPGGPIEEAGATARSFFDVMRQQPATLALIVSNAAMLIFIFYALNSAAKFRETLLANQYTLMKETSQLLAKCVVPGGYRVEPYTTEPIKPIGEVPETPKPTD